MELQCHWRIFCWAASGKLRTTGLPHMPVHHLFHFTPYAFAPEILITNTCQWTIIACMLMCHKSWSASLKIHRCRSSICLVCPVWPVWHTCQSTHPSLAISYCMPVHHTHQVAIFCMLLTHHTCCLLHMALQPIPDTQLNTWPLSYWCPRHSSNPYPLTQCVVPNIVSPYSWVQGAQGTQYIWHTVSIPQIVWFSTL